MRNALIAASLLLLVATASAGAAGSGEALNLSWPQLVPPVAQSDSIKSKGFLAGARRPGAAGGDAAPAPNVPEAGWMSMRWQQPGGGAPPAVVAELDGKRVRIGGYVVPLDFDATKVKEFLLVPFVGACIHVPPPPANQIIYVKSEQGFEVNGQFDPVYVTGTITTAGQFTGLAATGYTITAEKVDLRQE